ncbi:MAG TPA: glutamate racemase [Ktedonobacteraceae bacterium]|nr:glutamate racemase [Ktedonobacteraceae bacterium]
MASEHEISAESPVGVFDSGVGGLTILAEIRKALPLENYVYLGDTAHCPYGMRSEAEIAELSIINCRFLIEQDAKLIIVACNTASQAALNALRATYSIPFIGVVPAVKPAARATKRGRIGVIATNQAAQAAYLHQLIADFANDNEVYTAGCPELVTLAEQGQFDGPAVEATLRHALQPLLQRDIDVLVLGCTHFPALRPAIERVVGPDVQIIDSGSAIARRTRTILESANLLRAADTQPGFQGTLQVWSSGNAESFGEIATRLLGYPVIAQHASL